MVTNEVRQNLSNKHGISIDVIKDIERELLKEVISWIKRHDMMFTRFGDIYEVTEDDIIWLEFLVSQE